MGSICSSCSKADTGTAQKAEKFEKVGLDSVDNFFGQCDDVKTSFEQITAPLVNERDKLLELTGFEWIPGTRLNHIVIGMFLTLSAHVNGKMNDLNIEFIMDPPFVTIDFSKIENIAEQIFNAFCAYVEAAYKAMTEELPKIIEKANGLVE